MARNTDVDGSAGEIHCRLRQPFWRERGLSGEGRSARGPLGEIHDASMPVGGAAMFGLFGVPAQVRWRVAADVLRMHCRTQLVRMFGVEAATPRAEFVKDWADEPHTATAGDLEAASHHTQPPTSGAASGLWQGRLTGIASEWSPQFPGYVAGAIEAATLAVRALPRMQPVPPGLVPVVPEPAFCRRKP